MSKRRSPGDGAVFQASNGRWIATVELPRSPAGKRTRRRRHARTRAEALRYLREMKSEIEHFGTPSSTNRTLEATIAEYVEGTRRPSEQTTGTRNKDKMFTDAITAYLGWRKTADLRVQDVETFLEDFADGKANASGRPVSKDYVRRARSFIAAALRNDMRLGYIHVNVAEIANLPSTEVTSKERRALTVEQWRALYDAASGTTKLVVDLAGRHGLRPQELRALRWSAVRLKAGTLSVVTQFDSNDQFVDPKTTGSTRTIHMHPELVDALSTWRARQPHCNGVDLVFTSRVGTPIRQENLRRSIREACHRAGIEVVTPYELRHTAITHQVDAGHPVTVIADWAGTSEKMIFEHYRHRITEVVGLRAPDYGTLSASTEQAGQEKRQPSTRGYNPNNLAF